MSNPNPPNQDKIADKMIVEGEVRNPNGYPKGMKNARTIVKEFMDKKIDTLEGTRVSRFQYLLWSMYEMNQRMMKDILKFRVEDFKTAKKRLLDATEHPPEDEKEKEKLLARLERELRSRSKEYESSCIKVQDQQGKLSEFLLKASGQYLEKKEIETKTRQPLLITLDDEDMKEALEELKNEF